MKMGCMVVTDQSNQNKKGTHSIQLYSYVTEINAPPTYKLRRSIKYHKP